MKKLADKHPGLRQPLGAVRRKAISLSQGDLIKSAIQYGEALPLVIQPAVADIEIADWIEGNQEFIEARLLKYGAILFRGFSIDTAPAFERLGLSVCPGGLFNENGEHPREVLSGSVYTPIFYPADRKLLWHNENSFNHRWPLKILFGCCHPAQQGGETPIVDSRKIFQLIDPKIRDRFVEKQVMYLRNYGDGLGLGWETVFGTTKRSEVEAACRQASIDLEWKADGRLRTRAVRPAVAKHPKTGEVSWFNQAQHWHPACLDPETRESLLSAFTGENLPRNCCYGDRTPIEDSVMEAICDVYQQLEVTFPWERGDVLVLDNVLTAHGRNPFNGERKLFVAMGELASFADI